jgi:hypothetical protein
MLTTLILSLLAGATGETAPAVFKIVKDAKGVCQISVPPDWDLLSGAAGAAVLQSSTTAIAVVTSQPGQDFKPLSESLQKLLGIRKDKLFENTAKRIFYQDKMSQGSEDSNSFSASVPGKAGTCSCRVVLLPSVPEETAKKIALTLGPAPEQTAP